MNRRTQPSIQRHVQKAGKKTTRTVRRAWRRHSDRLANDPDYRDALFDVAVIIASTVIRHPLIRLLDTRLVLRWGSHGHRSHDEDRGWRPG